MNETTQTIPVQYPTSEASPQVAQEAQTVQTAQGTVQTVQTVQTEQAAVQGQTTVVAQETTPVTTTEATPEEETEQVKPYTLKRLQSKDIFPMMRILSKINFRELKACFSSPEIAAAVEKLINKTEGEEGTEGTEDIFSAVGFGVAFDVAGVIINNLPSCENELYSFLANLSGMKVDKIMNLDAVVFFEMIVDVIKKPEFKDFIKVASGLLK